MSTASIQTERPIAPVLILSTGRCGSTLVSSMLERHPGVLSLSEFFVPLGAAAFAFRRPGGERLWKILSCQSPALHTMLKDGEVVEEGLYPHDDPASRFSAADMPPIMATTLPHLTPQFEALYDELERFVRPLPRAPLDEQYRTLFDYLRRRFERRVWVERSGGSLMIATKLLRLFPEARVVHVYRDGREAAMSMSRHRNFRVLLATLERLRRLGVDVQRSFLQDRVNPLELLVQRLFFRLVDLRPDMERLQLADFGAFWSDLVELGHGVFGHFGPGRLLNLRFEDLTAEPRRCLSELIRFIDPSLEDPDWLTETAGMLRPTRSKFERLPADEQAALQAACAPGLARLGYAG